MQEEISLREILETLWKGKKIIAIVTLICMLISGLFSFFVLSPSYEAESIVRFSNSLRDSGERNTAVDMNILNSYMESLKSDVSINRVIEKLELNKTTFNINSLRNNLETTLVKDANVIKIKLKGEDPVMITRIANLLAYEMGARAEITDRTDIVVTAKNQLLQLDDEIKITQSEVNEANKRLQNTPEKLITKKSLSEDASLQSIAAESRNIRSSDAAALQMINEEVNPVYTALQARIAEASINLSKLMEEKSTLENKIGTNEKAIADVTGQLNSEKLTARNTERFINGLNAVFISPALEPNMPVGPNKLFNIVIAAVVGALLSVMMVFFRHYWRNGSSSNDIGSKFSV